MATRSRFTPRRPMNRPRPARVDVFGEIVRRVPAVEAARLYGVAVNNRGLALCPFHAEDTPSCRFYPGDRGFYCFGCGAGGDVIALAERMFGLSPLDAAKKLDADFGLGLFEGGNPLSAARIYAARTQEQRAEDELERLRRITPDADPAAWAAAQGRIEYLEYYLEEVRAEKCLKKMLEVCQPKPNTPKTTT